jgi:putative mycofactocin binding protein MftB
VRRLLSELDPSERYRLHPDVALRPEPFGALAYHYGSRRLTFLRSPLLAEVVRHLQEHESVDSALAALVPEAQRGQYLRALTSLAESRFLCAV